MLASKKFTGLLIFALSFLLFSCGSNDKNETAVHEKKSSNKIIKTKCDKIIEDYDKLVSKAIEYTKANLNGEEIDKAEQEKLTKEAEELAKKIQKLGVTGLGGTHCYEEFANIQLKWSQSFIDIQQQAIEQAMKNLENQ